MKLKISTMLLCLSFFGFVFSQSTPTQADDSGECIYTYTFTVTNNHPVSEPVEARFNGEFDDGTLFTDIYDTSDLYARTPSGEAAIQPGETGTLVVSHTAPLGYAFPLGSVDTDPDVEIVQSDEVTCDNGDDDNGTGTPDDGDDNGDTDDGDDNGDTDDGDDNDNTDDGDDNGNPDNGDDDGDDVEVIKPRPDYSEIDSIGRVVRSLRWGGDEYGFVIINYNNPFEDAIELSPAFLAELPESPEQNTEFASSEDGLTRFYVLTTGEFQVNFGPDFEGKVHVVVFDRGFNIKRIYTFK
jgi:hypothetical protein